MLSANQIQALLLQNKSLQAEVQELNEILAIKEEEMAELRKKGDENAALRSMIDIHLEELQFMQNRIGKQQQKAAGAEDREMELHQELTQAAKVQHQYNDLLRQYTYINTQLDDVEEELTKIKKRNTILQQIAVKIGEMESAVEMLAEEKELLQHKITLLQKMHST